MGGDIINKKGQKMINIGIPTRGRPEKLRNCVENICSEYVSRIVIICYDKAADISPNMKPLHNVEIIESKDMMTIASHNFCCSSYGGSFICLSDDTEFPEGSIKKAYEELISNFHGTDGIVDFHVSNMNSPNGCYMLVGEEFINRFPGRQPFFPEYRFMYASAELRDCAMELGRFYHSKEATIKHFHPSAGFAQDETHKRIRQSDILTKDRETYERRKDENLLWGYNDFGDNNQKGQ